MRAQAAGWLGWLWELKAEADKYRTLPRCDATLFGAASGRQGGEGGVLFPLLALFLLGTDA